MRSQVSKSWIYSLILMGSLTWAGIALTNESSKVGVAQVLPFSSAPMPADQLKDSAKKYKHC